MKRIQLTRGKVTIVDDEDYEELNKYKWQCNYYGYASRRNGDIPRWHMAWDIIGKPRGGMVIDHIHGNKLDNRKEELRFATRSQNAINSKMFKTNTSGYRGICWNKYRQKWMARISVNNKRIYLGCYTDKKMAADVYNEAAIVYFGKFVKLNTT